MDNSVINNYFGRSEVIDDINIYPLSILDWLDVNEIIRKYLVYGYDFIKYKLKPKNKDDIKLFDLVISIVAEDIIKYNTLNCKSVVELQSVFKYVTKTNCNLELGLDNNWCIRTEDNKIINRNNFDKIREVIMQQNLIFEPLLVEDEYTQEIIDEEIMRRNRVAGDFDIVSMIAYVSVKRGITPREMQDYTYFQLRCDNEICQRLEFNESIHHYRSQGAKVDSINMYGGLDCLKNPNSWDSFFKKNDSKADADMMKAMNG